MAQLIATLRHHADACACEALGAGGGGALMLRDSLVAGRQDLLVGSCSATYQLRLTPNLLLPG